MKIGILTYHRSHNYGAMLQAYALKTFLIELGHSVEFVDYWPLYRKDFYHSQKLSFFRKIIGFRREVFTFHLKRRKYKLFNDFLINELSVKGGVSVRYGREISDDYDFIICGSDQIWRNYDLKEIKGIDEVYWGAYPEKSKAKKIAYAASMGHLNPQDFDSNQIKSVLSNFSSISVREELIKDFIQPFSSDEIKCVLDPIFLLDISKWGNLFNSRIRKNKYLLFYNLLNHKEYREEVKGFAKERGLEIIEVRGGVSPLNFNSGLQQILGPKEFLSLIYHAEFVISKSFHGVAFAILFEKQFLALGMGENAERVKSLLKSLDIQDRYISNRVAINSQINFQNVKERLNILKIYSTSFLTTALSK